MEDKRIIEINGVKLELDLRTAELQQIDSFKVGDNVKVLVKENSYSEQEIKPGVIVGFDNFKSLPTIIVAWLSVDYSKAEIKYAYINAKSEVEIVAASSGDVPFERELVMDLLDRDIAAKEIALSDAKSKKEVFLKQFGRLFTSITETVKAD